MLYKIGEFSRMSMLSIKTLRYYHEIGLLVPESIDESTGYRFYDEAAFDKSKVIRLLREFEFTNKEMLEIFQQYEDASDIKAYLLEKHEMIQERINHYKRLQKRIMNFEAPKEATHMHEKVKIIELEPTLVATLVYVGKYNEVGQYISKLFKAVGGNVAAKPMSIYHDDEYKEDEATVEVCLPLKREINYKSLETKVLPGGKAVSLLHVGPYENLSDSYKQFTDYIKTNQLTLASPIREQYLKGPGMLLKGNPDKYQTLIMALIK